MENNKEAKQTRKSGKTVYVGNMSYSRDENGVKDLFSQYGQIRFIELMTDSETGNSKGYAFVKMVDAQSAMKAIKELNGKLIDGRTIKVSEAIESEQSKTSRKPRNPKASRELAPDNVKKEKSITPPATKKGKPVKNKKGLDALKNYLNS